jgi:hypothetical protein
MKRSWPLLLLLLPYQSIHAREVKYAPTVEQCRADQRLWLSKLETPKGTTLLPNFWEIRSWSDEMSDCPTVDPAFFSLYDTTDREIAFEMISGFGGSSSGIIYSGSSSPRTHKANADLQIPTRQMPDSVIAPRQRHVPHCRTIASSVAT